MGKERKSFPLRISTELFKELRAWAEQEMRSVNGQIEFLLRDAVKKRKSPRERSSHKPVDEPESHQPTEKRTEL